MGRHRLVRVRQGDAKIYDIDPKGQHYDFPRVAQKSVHKPFGPTSSRKEKPKADEKIVPALSGKQLDVSGGRSQVGSKIFWLDIGPGRMSQGIVKSIMSARKATIIFWGGRSKVGSKTFWVDIRRGGYAKGRRKKQHRPDMSKNRFSKGSPKVKSKTFWADIVW